MEKIKENEPIDNLLNTSYDPETAKQLMLEDEFVKHNLKIMNGLPLIDHGGIEPDYNELYSNVVLKDKLPSSYEFSLESFDYYYRMLYNGFETFGLEYLMKLCTEYTGHACVALRLFLDCIMLNANVVMEKVEEIQKEESIKDLEDKKEEVK